ncbi:MAG TPA: response regulator [Candidatus Saccharimonadales bacterium]|jgi:DNA-binding response OmpR family regulator
MANILLVEDDKDLIEAYALVLKAAKHNIKKAYDGKQALVAVKEFNPDLILLDLLMPVKSGKEFLKEYKKDKASKDVKIIVFSNLQDSNELEDVYSLGADRYIIKSWTGPHGLLKIVGEVLATE